jgi:SHS2 domain-containing protein
MNREPSAGYEPVDHPADLCFLVWAPDRPALFHQAARALLETLFPDGHGGGGAEDATSQTDIRLEGVDDADLLVRWLGELLFQAESRQRAPAAIRFLHLGGGKLRADCLMRPAGLPACEIKAVTYHQSGIRESGEGLEATLLFDV